MTWPAGATRRRAAVLREVLAYCRSTKLYYSEAQAAMLLAVCEHALGHEAEVLGHLRRALDLAARYDYEYWFQRSVAQFPQVFCDAGGRGAYCPPTCANSSRRARPRRAPPRRPNGPRSSSSSRGRRPT